MAPKADNQKIRNRIQDAVSDSVIN